MRLADFPCSLCGSTKADVRLPATRRESGQASAAFSCTHSGYGSHFRILNCHNCRFVYCSPRPVAEDVAQLYGDVEDPIYLNELGGRAITFARRVSVLEGYRKPPARLLDVGAYVGSFVAAARNRGFDAVGLEPSTWAVTIAAKAGLPVRQGTLTADSFPHGSFDVVTLWDVIEHLADPFQGLRDAHALLRDRGLVVVHTMDIDSVLSRLLGHRWPWLMEMHLHYFSKKTLAVMLEKAGFRVLRVVPEARHISLGYLATRVEALMGRTIGRPFAWLVRVCRLEKVMVPIALGDLVTAYAEKPEHSPEVS